MLAAIKNLPGTIEDRSLIVQLARKPRGVKLDRLRLGDQPYYAELRSRAARWADDHGAAVGDGAPDTPGLDNRNADNWRPLIAIAEIVGEPWPERALAAAKAAHADTDPDDLSLQLLADIRRAFAELGLESVQSSQLVDKLIALPDSPWSEMPDTGRMLTGHRLARMLRDHGIKPQKGRKANQYNLSAFQEAFASFLPPRGSQKFRSSEVPKFRSSATC